MIHMETLVGTITFKFKTNFFRSICRDKISHIQANIFNCVHFHVWKTNFPKKQPKLNRTDSFQLQISSFKVCFLFTNYLYSFSMSCADNVSTKPSLQDATKEIVFCCSLHNFSSKWFRLRLTPGKFISITSFASSPFFKITCPNNEPNWSNPCPSEERLELNQRINLFNHRFGLFLQFITHNSLRWCSICSVCPNVRANNFALQWFGVWIGSDAANQLRK